LVNPEIDMNASPPASRKNRANEELAVAQPHLVDDKVNCACPGILQREDAIFRAFGDNSLNGFCDVIFLAAGVSVANVAEKVRLPWGLPPGPVAAVSEGSTLPINW
jgi:hypothetical protein